MRRDTLTDMLELHVCSEDEVRHTHWYTDMLEFHAGSKDEVRHSQTY